MKKRHIGKIVLTLFTLAVWSSLMVGGCGGGGDDNNPFVWPKLESQVSITHASFDIPIAIVLDEKGGPGPAYNQKWWYICNQGSTANSGFISRVAFGSSSPEPAELKWVDNLNYPRGMGLTEDHHRLVVALATSVVVINTGTGLIERTINVSENGGANPATNLGGVVIRDNDARYYVSDATNKRIYRGFYGTDNSTENLRGDSLFDNIDALLLSRDEEYLFAGTTDQIYSLHIGDNNTEPEEFIDAPDNTNVNGLVKIYGSMYIFSSRNKKEIWAVDTSSNRQRLSDMPTGTPGYIYVYVDESDDDTHYLYVPNMEGNQVLVYKITPDYDNSPIW